LFGGVEVEVDDDVARVVDGALQAVPAYSGLFPDRGEAVEGALPGVEVGDGVFDVEGGHTLSSG